MKVGVIGSGSIGPDLAYGFATALAGTEEGHVHLLDIKQGPLDTGLARIQGYVKKGLARGKVSPRTAQAIDTRLVGTLDLRDLSDCDYVLEAATEDLVIKQAILADVERVVGKDCLIGFATSGIPRSRIAANATHPERCFVNHPFYPAWRALPIEVVLSDDAALSDRMVATLRRLGKIPIVTGDVPCFAADDIFCNYCAEAARIVDEGTASPAQVDKIVNDAIGGGGPFNVMDLTRGNLLNVHCLELMKEAETGSDWFTPPPIFTEQGNTPWHDRKQPGDPAHDPALGKQVLNRILAVLLGRTYFVIDNGICEPRELNWLTRNALGFRAGLLDLAEELGATRVHDTCAGYAATNPGFPVPPSIAESRLASFHRNVKVTRDNEIATVTICRPEVRNALNEQTVEELRTIFTDLEADANIHGVVLTSLDGALAGADIMELAALKTAEEAEAKCRNGQAVLSAISTMRKPVVAAVDGPVLGGGAELSMACHARVVGPGLVLGQPEVNLGIIPGYGGTQRLPRLIGLDRAVELLRSGRTIGAREACEWGWGSGEPVADVVSAARALLRRHLAGKTKIARISPEPIPVLPRELPQVDIGHRSLTIDAILVQVLRDGLGRSLDEGCSVEAAGFARCHRTVDYDIGMTNFIQNGPRVPAVFMHE